MTAKIERVTERYGIDPTTLEEKYKEGLSLRQLEEWLNTRVVQSATQQTGNPVSLRKACNIATVLSDKEQTGLPTKPNCRSRLRSLDIKPEQVTKDFISYQTIRHYLQERGVDTSRTDGCNPEGQLDAVLKLKYRLRDVIDASIERLVKHDYADVRSPQLSLSITITCDMCREEWKLPEFFSGEVVCSCEM